MPNDRSPSISARLRRDFSARVYDEACMVQGSNWEAGFALALHLSLIVLTGMACELLVRQSPAGWLVYPFALLFIGTRFRAMGNMLHEACHGLLVKGKRKNVIWGSILAVLDFTRLEPYTHEHFSHHRYLGDWEKDLDFVTRKQFGFGENEPRFVLRHYLRPLSLFHLPTFLKPIFFHREDGWPVRLGRLAYLGALGAVAYVAGPVPVLLYFVVPYCTLYQVIRYWSDAVDHAGAIPNDDEFNRSRNHIFGVELLNRILFPRFDEYHLVHHLFPAVPVKHQRRVHQILLEDPEYAARQHDIRFTHLEAAAPLRSATSP